MRWETLKVGSKLRAILHPGLSHEHDGSFRLHVVLLTARYFLRVLKRIDRASEENVSVRIRNQITRLL